MVSFSKAHFLMKKKHKWWKSETRFSREAIKVYQILFDQSFSDEKNVFIEFSVSKS